MEGIRLEGFGRSRCSHNFETTCQLCPTRLSQTGGHISIQIKETLRKRILQVAQKMLNASACSIAAMLVRTQAGVSPASRIIQLLL